MKYDHTNPDTYPSDYAHVADDDPDYVALLHSMECTVGTNVYPFGSRYISGPDGGYNDTDVLINVGEGVHERLTEAGFEPQFGAGYAGAHIASWRKGNINAVVMTDEWEFWARCACVEFCRVQGVRNKDRRRSFHSFIADVARVEPDSPDQLNFVF